MSALFPMRRDWRHRIIFLVVIALGLSSLLIGVPRTQAQTAACAQTYTVRAGDNLFRIALAAGTTYPVLAALNGITNPNLIYVGQVLCLPDTVTTLPGVVPVVVPGSTVVPGGTPIVIVPGVTVGATATPIISGDLCITQLTLTVQVTSYIYYAPDKQSRTAELLLPGSKFPVCTNNPRTDWVAFLLDGVGPLWVPVGVFG